MRISIAIKINIIIFLVVLVLGGVLGTYFIKEQTMALNDELSRGIDRFGNYLSQGVEIVTSKNDVESVNRVLQSAALDGEIAYIIVKSVDGEILAARWAMKNKGDIGEHAFPLHAVRVEDKGLFGEAALPAEGNVIGHLAIGYNYSHLLARRKKLLWRTALGVVAGASVAMIIGFFLVRILLQHSMKPVLVGIKEIGSGNLSHRIATEHGDEIGEIGKAFNDMAGKLEEKTAEQKSSLREKETLLRELHHRTKNNMQIMMSLINLQIASVSNKQDAYLLNDAKNRIMSMALVHEKIYGSKDLSNVNLKSYIRDLASAILRSYQVDTIKVVQIIEVDEMDLSIETVIPIGLILNELMTNTLKYAFPGNAQGEIRISAHLSENGQIQIIYGDNGIGFPAGFDLSKTHSLGLNLVSNLVRSQLQGRLRLKNDNGSEFIITFTEPFRKNRI